MERLGLMAVLCVSVLAASAHSAVLPTLQELVVAGDHPIVRRSVDSVTNIPYQPIKKTEMRVRSEVALRYARTSVITHVANPDSRPQEATFRMLLPDTAFISGFTMIIGGKPYKAYVKSKLEAKQIYTQAVSQGSAAAHVATKARNSNHFTVSVNVEGNTTAIFDLRYEDFLVRRNGLYSHVINLHPGALVPVMEVVVHIKESQKIIKLEVPELRTGNEIDATKNDAQNPMAVIRRGTNYREVTVTFTPDLKEQRRLAKIYMDKSSGDGTALGQFVVEYDVERSNDDEILVNDGYFVHFLAPTLLPPLSKHVVFVLDTSWSMAGRKIDQLRKAMDTILSELKPYDYFNIVEFKTEVMMYELRDGDNYIHYSQYYNEYSVVPPAIASWTNIAKAKAIVSGLYDSGFTNIMGALDAALTLVKKGVHQNTDHNEHIKLSAQSEPIIIFLTDGEPVVGETKTDVIIERVTQRNTGDMKAAIYSLAFGDGADRDFLRKLSLRNNGFMRHIYEAADAALQLQDFYRQVSSPLLANVKFTYPANQIKAGSVSQSEFRTINKGSEVVIVGQIADDVTEMTPQILGFCGAGQDLGLIRYVVDSTVVVNRTKDEHLPLERLWAYLTIKQLLDKRDAGDHSTGENSPEKKALDIALKYAFVTPLTSLVVVKPHETSAVDVESADKLPTGAPTSFTPLSAPNAPAPTTPRRALMPSYSSDAYDTDRSFIASSKSSGYPGRLYGMMSNNIGAPTSFTPLSAPNAPAPTTPAPTNPRRALLPTYSSDAYDTDRSFIASSKSSGYPGRLYGMMSNNIGYDNTYTLSIDGAPGNNYLFTKNQFDYDDSLISSLNSYVTETIVPPTTTTRTKTQAPITSRSNYNLEGYSWTSSLLNASAGALAVRGTNGEQVFLKLTTDINPPVAVSGDVACSNSTYAVDTSDETGSVCVYVTRCYAARSITADDYQNSYCVVNNRYAGICCPEDKVMF
ncbi:inter-alpha-trypsin inhibitor heavy chain H3 [Bicyclus anynana]|uniref:Inter-alpha-trypsin inhibitor heavy chain H3 n=1 Tax=Bicyclus anynana TaxID=110368 RepID=A0ABM3LDL6_BICAN|nr:inter-alpha-trypsin inhibitor heavy chain H3 [Bicyclus anynana]